MELVILFALASHAELRVERDAEALREQLLTWSESLHSFSGSYVLHDRWPGLPGDQARPPVERPVTFRFDSEDRFVQRVDPLEDGGQVTVWISRLGGRIVHRRDYVYPDGREDYTYVTLDATNSWPEPEGAYVSPLTLFHAGQYPSLRTFLATGESAAHERDGFRVLSHRKYPESRDRLDVWFDPEDRVVSISIGVGVNAPYTELLERWEGDPFQAFKKYTTWEILGYAEVNGVLLPTSAQRVSWQYPENEFAVLRQRLLNQEIDLTAFQVGTIVQAGRPYEVAVQDFSLHPEEVRVNIPLKPADFEIPVPVGAELKQGKDGPITVYPGSWFYRVTRPLPLALGGAIALITLTLVALLLRRCSFRRS